jgi:hypothetical protein
MPWLPWLPCNSIRQCFCYRCEPRNRCLDHYASHRLKRPLARVPKTPITRHSIIRGSDFAPAGRERSRPKQSPAENSEGPIYPDALADHIVKPNVCDLDALLNRVIRALAKAGMCAAQVTRNRRIADTHGKVHAIEVVVYSWKLIVLIEASTKIPLSPTVVPIQAHETLSSRALVRQARTNLAGHARLYEMVFDNGFWNGVGLWWLQQYGILFVVPAKEHMAVTVDAQAQADASEGINVGRRVQTFRHG